MWQVFFRMKTVDHRPEAVEEEGRRNNTEWLNSVFKAFLLAFTITVTILVPEEKWENEKQRPLCVTVLTWAVIANYTLLKLTSELHKVFLIFGLFKNPIFAFMSGQNSRNLRWCLQIAAAVVKSLTCLSYVALIKMVSEHHSEPWPTAANQTKLQKFGGSVEMIALTRCCH